MSRSPSWRRAAYAACSWAAVFTAISFYWAAGRAWIFTGGAETTRMTTGDIAGPSA